MTGLPCRPQFGCASSGTDAHAGTPLRPFGLHCDHVYVVEIPVSSREPVGGDRGRELPHRGEVERSAGERRLRTSNRPDQVVRLRRRPRHSRSARCRSGHAQEPQSSAGRRTTLPPQPPAVADADATINGVLSEAQCAARKRVTARFAVASKTGSAPAISCSRSRLRACVLAQP